jgi:hypothetical protein
MQLFLTQYVVGIRVQINLIQVKSIAQTFDLRQTD